MYSFEKETLPQSTRDVLSPGAAAAAVLKPVRWSTPRAHSTPQHVVDALVQRAAHSEMQLEDALKELQTKTAEIEQTRRQRESWEAAANASKELPNGRWQTALQQANHEPHRGHRTDGSTRGGSFEHAAPPYGVPQQHSQQQHWHYTSGSDVEASPRNTAWMQGYEAPTGYSLGPAPPPAYSNAVHALHTFPHAVPHAAAPAIDPNSFAVRQPPFSSPAALPWPTSDMYSLVAAVQQYNDQLAQQELRVSQLSRGMDMMRNIALSNAKASELRTGDGRGLDHAQLLSGADSAVVDHIRALEHELEREKRGRQQTQAQIRLLMKHKHLNQAKLVNQKKNARRKRTKSPRGRQLELVSDTSDNETGSDWDRPVWSSLSPIGRRRVKSRSNGARAMQGRDGSRSSTVARNLDTGSPHFSRLNPSRSDSARVVPGGQRIPLQQQRFQGFARQDLLHPKQHEKLSRSRKSKVTAERPYAERFRTSPNLGNLPSQARATHSSITSNKGAKHVHGPALS